MNPQEAEGVTFSDASAFFPGEEWRLLHDWQKELYRNVMKEIHQALISLCPLIVNTVFSLRTKEKQELCSMDKRAVKRRHENKVPPFPIKCEEESHSWSEKKAGNTCPPGCPGYFLPECADHSGEYLAELLHTSWKKGNELDSSPIKCEAETDPIRNQDANRDEIYSVAHQDIERDAIYCVELEDSEREESLYNSSGERHWSRIKRSEDSEPACEVDPFISLLERTGPISEHQINSEDKVWSERNLELGSQRICLRKSGCSELADGSSQLETLALPRQSRSKEIEGHLSRTSDSSQSNAPKGRSPYICTTYAKVFHERKNFSTHLQTHAKVFRFQCIYCEKQFNHKGHFYTHMRTHTKETPFTCTECGKSFSQKGNLKTHLKTHSEERPFQCPDCGKGFKLKGNLVEHRAAHSGYSIARPYQCIDCGKRFNRKGKYEAHMRIHM
ncbi:uncharacterized protein LOC144799517 isoform X2 [Lissotriton helveticus]